MQEFEKQVHKLLPDIYSFAYILIPDDLQAGQLVSDALAAVVFESKVFFERIVGTEKADQQQLEQFRSLLISHIYFLGKKRYQHIKLSLAREVDRSPFGQFAHLEVDERAVLFLRHKLKMDLKQIESVTLLEAHELLMKLNSGRSKLIDVEDEAVL